MAVPKSTELGIEIAVFRSYKGCTSNHLYILNQTVEKVSTDSIRKTFGLLLVGEQRNESI